MELRNLARNFCPPVVWSGLTRVRGRLSRMRPRPAVANPTEQDLDLYWDPKMAALLESWGEGSVWKEIQLLLATREGKVLDIACGTGRVIEILSDLPVEVHGCDISSLLLTKAAERGIQKERLTECDATNLPYESGAFHHAYSIGSLEHFTEDGIGKFLAESQRVTSVSSFHNIPVSRSDRNEGWISPYQSYFNNSIEWWLGHFKPHFARVSVLPSTWEDPRSLGAWFVCEN